MPSVSRENSATRRLSAFFLPTSSGSKLRPEIQNNSTADLRVRGRSPARRLTRNDRGSSVYPPSSAPRSPTFGSTPRRSVSIRDAFRDPLVLLQPPPIHIEGAVSGPPSPALSRINSRSLSASHIPSLGPPTWPGAQDKRTKRRSWFPSSKSKFRVEEQPPPRAWVVGHPTKEPYDILELVNGVKVAELWDEYGGMISTRRLKILELIGKIRYTGLFISTILWQRTLIQSQFINLRIVAELDTIRIWSQIQ